MRSQRHHLPVASPSRVLPEGTARHAVAVPIPDFFRLLSTFLPFARNEDDEPHRWGSPSPCAENPGQAPSGRVGAAQRNQCLPARRSNCDDTPVRRKRRSIHDLGKTALVARGQPPGDALATAGSGRPGCLSADFRQDVFQAASQLLLFGPLFAVLATKRGRRVREAPATFRC
jgi:hypothetical protein